MEHWKLAELSIAELMAEAATVTRGSCARTTTVAVLGDCATQNYVQALTATLKLRGCWPSVYEGGFGQISQEILDPASGLHEVEPAFAVLFHALQTLQDRWFTTRDRARFAATVAEEIEGHWDRLLASGETTVLQHNYCLPLERPFGNFSAQCSASFPYAVRTINDLLGDAAARRKGVAIIDTEYQASYFGRKEWLSERFWCLARQALAPQFLPPLVKSVTDAILARMGVLVKCVILDLDNTLWSGILGDDGIDGIALGDAGVGLAFQRFQRAVAQLKDRGILLAVCSKNREDLAREVFRRHPEMALKEDDIVAFVVNFENKAANIRKIGAMLDLALDSFVFLDDSPFERELIRTTLPEVQVPELPDDPAEFLSALGRWNLFEAVDTTAEDIERVGMYKANVTRVELRESCRDLETYLATLEMAAEVAPLDTFSLPRVAQLVLRSNQFNVMTLRHGEPKLQELAASPRHAAFTIRLRDRLGDNGLVVCAIGAREGTDFVIDTWVMSCRVLGRRVEELTMALLVEQAREMGCARVIGQYRPTSKNGMVADLYPRMGFAELESRGDVRRFALDVDDYESPELPIRVDRKTPHGAAHR